MAPLPKLTTVMPYQFVVSLISVVCIVVAHNAVAQNNHQELWFQSTGLGSLSRLTCRKEYRGDPYSVRWYKIEDGQELEFYRYDRDADPQEEYPVTIAGVRVDDTESGRNIVGLCDVDESASGEYKCTMTIEDGQSPLNSTFTVTFSVPVEPNRVVDVFTNSTGPGSSVTLVCDVGAPTDQSWHFGFKWYTANNVEIYRFSNWNRQQPEIVFPVTSVHVDVERSNGSHLTLETLEEQSFGIYKCFSYAEVPRTKSSLYKINLQYQS